MEVDYAVIGAGAMGIAFADVLLTETDATVAIIDRYGRPGGHWTRAYPFVRLHQPSAFYGVNSRVLGNNRKDTTGGNAGLYELASGAEVLAYFDLVMNEQLLPTGRLHYLPMCEYGEGGAVVSLVSGQRQQISAKKIVDSTYMQVRVPSMRPPPFAVADGVHCVPPNALTTMDQAASDYVVIGAGKTGIDTCLWLLGMGVDPDRIIWIMPRDSWLLDRTNIQPGPEYFEGTVGGFARQIEASALATTLDDLFERLETAGLLLRLDPSVRPTMYHCATVTPNELEDLRRIKNIVRMGHVRSLEAGAIVLDHGTIQTSAEALHIDCSANGTARRPETRVFDGDRIVLQPVRTCQQVFSAAFIAYVETAFTDEAEKNDICAPIPHPDTPTDWLRQALVNTTNTIRWGSYPALTKWLNHARLNVTASFGVPTTQAEFEILGKVGTHTPGAIANLGRLLADAGD
jgi:hypothetical protein